MILVHCAVNLTGREGSESIDRHLLKSDEPIPDNALWIDLIEPTRADDRKVEAFLNIQIPTSEEMADIEPSEILYTESDARYMTARVLCHSETEQPSLVNITFILTEKALVTVRYDEPRSFAMFTARAVKVGGGRHQPEAVLDGLIETIIDRAAEILANVGTDIDALSRSIFETAPKTVRRVSSYRNLLQMLGRKGDLISNTRESMVSVERLLLFLSSSMVRPKKASGFQAEWRTAIRDVQSIEEHATFLANKIQFLLDATLGLVSIEQNDIIKLFSVMAVIFMPPTLVASIYGMNFKHMPELEWTLGYPMAVVIMLIAAVFPYALFRWKKWL
jgi:magnesium transporter